VVSNNGKTVLIDASCNGHVKVVKLLIEAGAKVNEKNDGDSAISMASNNRHTDIVELLVEAGATIDMET
jgi:ankyrin repeat protein